MAADVVDCDVAIIGYGPVGATLAGLLAGRGVRTLVIDREVDIYPLPRAAHVDHEIMRIMQELGCADEMLAGMRPNPGMDFLTADHEVLLSMRSPGLTSLGWPASVFINQPLFERQLREAVSRLGATTLLGSGVAAIDSSEAAMHEHADRVQLTLDDGSIVTARYVVGCDGARSFTRRTLGIGSHDLEFEEPWLVVDMLINDADSGLSSHCRSAIRPDRTRWYRCPHRASGSSSCCCPARTPWRCRHPRRSPSSPPAGCPPAQRRSSAAPCTRFTD